MESKCNTNNALISPNLITIENQLYRQDEFNLKNSKKGKIYNSKVTNAFNRNSLGSIPRKHENVLFKDELFDQKLGFNSKCVRFINNKNQNTCYYLNTYNLKSEDNNNNTNVTSNENTNYSLNSEFTSPSFSNKGYGNGFISKSSRFGMEYESYKIKYNPGPCEFNSNFNSISNNIAKSNTYKHIYKKSRKLSNNNDYSNSPGPGSYNIRTNLINNSINNKIWFRNNQQVTPNEIIRLSENKKKFVNKLPLDTCINISLKSNIQNSDLKLKNNNELNLNKSASFKLKSENINNNENKLNSKSFKKQLNEILNLNNKSYSNTSNFNNKNNNNFNAKNNLLNNSYLKNIIDKSTKLTNKNTFNFKSIIKDKYKSSFVNKNENNFKDNIYKDNSNFNFNYNNVLIKNKNTNRDDSYTKNKSYVFKSTSPRIPNNNVIKAPGPCYYRPDKISKNLSFNVYNSIFKKKLEYTNELKWI